MILEAADTKGPADGALLHLHGAMVTKAREDAEGELLARLRQKLGSRTPIIVTLDLHANVTRNMADNANAPAAVSARPASGDYLQKARRSPQQTYGKKRSTRLCPNSGTATGSMVPALTFRTGTR